MKRKLTDSIGIDDMLQMRADGATNSEIADRLECSYVTVLRYIGKEPKSIRTYARPVRQASSEEKMQSKESHEITAHRLTLVQQIFEGKQATFVIGNNEIAVKADGAELAYMPGEFEEFAKDVLAVCQLIRNTSFLERA